METIRMQHRASWSLAVAMMLAAVVEAGVTEAEGTVEGVTETAALAPVPSRM
jgi:hypothetical protein